MSSVAITGNAAGAGVFTLASPNSASSFTATLPTATTTLVGTDATQTLTNKTIQGGAITSQTAVTCAGQTSINFTDIPSWVKRVTVMFNGVSTSGTSQIIVQLGDAGGVEDTGYQSTASNNVDVVTSTAGIVFCDGSVPAAAASYTGVLTFVLITTNAWVVSGCGAREGNNNGSIAGGKTLSGTLDRVRITTAGGIDTFDTTPSAGTVNILYEG
jgi:hypothetical protein